MLSLLGQTSDGGNMSYCRQGPDSDVYIWGENQGELVCADNPMFRTTKRSDMINHLIYRHMLSGDKVPDHPILRLLKEIREEGDMFLP